MLSGVDYSSLSSSNFCSSKILFLILETKNFVLTNLRYENSAVQISWSKIPILNFFNLITS
jgi:hypothetical protein